ncbi:DNA polymerase III subunit chi [Candidatus Halobeggiatoa sp. HSG11]|nr:DNA polymerase III subunit chi [Candidatus Halobeggiatoa sp. HSG11]
MIQVDFYILKTNIRQRKERLACQIADKAWHQNYQIYVHSESQMAAEQLDMMMWVFKEESFLPHDVYYSNTSSIAPIQIGYTNQACKDMEVLINMSKVIPPFFEQFQRIAEIVDNNNIEREAGRNRYRFYKEQNYNLKVHEINH